MDRIKKSSIHLSSSSRILNPDRRMFLKTAALSGCAALITGIPLTTYVISPALKKSANKWIDLGSVEDLEERK